MKGGFKFKEVSDDNSWRLCQMGLSNYHAYCCSLCGRIFKSYEKFLEKGNYKDGFVKKHIDCNKKEEV